MTTRTRTASTRRKTATVVPQHIPADMMATGSVAVPIRFPDRPTAHRIAPYVPVEQGDTDDAAPAAWTAMPDRRDLRPACQTADTGPKVYEITAAFAHSRGAIACTDPACFGGAR